MNRPTWWSTKGGKMSVAGLRLIPYRPPALRIANGNVASLAITRNDDRRAEFRIDYSISHCDGSQTSGTIMMDRDDLAGAFGIKDGTSARATWNEWPTEALAYYGHPNAAVAGKYFRIGNYLNIPHPGTGISGDPNVSVEIKPEIKTAIEFLLDYIAARAA